jgi:16S rRNA (uracil1498-N3)-methyltransferase
MPSKPAIRLHIDAPLGGGARIALSREMAHRLRNVLRLKAGDAIALFNGRDGEWRAEIEALERGEGSVIAGERLREQRPDGDTWLAFAPVKRPRLEWLVEKATELGAAALLPVATEHTVADHVNRDRLAAIAREAAEQSERLTFPRIAEAVPLARLLILCDETGRAPAVADVLGALAPGPHAILIGPEGGFAERELDALRKLDFVSPVGLGPRILRSETAALAALALVQALQGDWSTARLRRYSPADASP